MAMGGPYSHNKGGSTHGNSSSSNRGRTYGLMLLLAFGAALLGVMVLHKLRERRIFNLVVKEKDTQLVSLHLALQKERDRSREVKKKHDELKAKVFSVRIQKMQLERTVMEMKSTIGSLKEELRTMEAAFEEKQNETKAMRMMRGDQNGNTRVMELEESLKQKEAEIEELKQRMDYKVWSVSADDPSKPAGNLTMFRRREAADQVSDDSNGEGNVSKSMNLKQGESRKELDGQTANADGETKVDSFHDVDKKGSNTTEEVQAKRAIDGQERNRNLHQVEDSENYDQSIHVRKERGMKLEMQEESENKGRSKVGGKRDYLKGGSKGKKGRLAARNRRNEKKANFRNNGTASMRGRRFFEDDQNKRSAEETASNRRLTSEVRAMLLRESGESSDAAENLKNKLTQVDSKDDYGAKVSGTASNDTKQEHEVETSEDQQKLSSKGTESEEDKADAEAQDFPGDLEIAEAEEQENDATEDVLLGDSGFYLEDREEYKEEIDASEY